MKKFVFVTSLIIFTLIISFSKVLSEQYTLKEGESIVFNGKTVTLSGVSDSDSLIVTVDGISKIARNKAITSINGLLIDVQDIFYYPKEQQVSSARLSIYSDTTTINKTCSDSDGGLDYYTKGTVSVCTFTDTGGSCGGLVDFCSGNILTEGYCKGSESKSIKYTCPYGCADGRCFKENETVKEEVKCVFTGSGSTTPQECYSDKGRCKSTVYDNQGACVVEVEGIAGEQIKWSSTCGGYAYTTMDSQNEYAFFYCGGNCTDSDGGKNYYVKGTVTKGNVVSSDCCAVNGYNSDCVSSSFFLSERYCDSAGNLNTEIINCSTVLTNGYCKDGVCANEKYCYDSDEGSNYYVKGYVDSSMAPGKTWDTCINNTLLLEYQCNPTMEGYDLGTNYNCPYGCEDGACVKSPVDADWHYVIVYRDQEPGWYCINITNQARLKFEFRKVNPDYARCLWATIDYYGPGIRAENCAPKSWGCYNYGGTLTPYNCWNFASCTADGGKLYRLCSGSDASFVVDLDENAKVACAYATVYPSDCPGKNCWQTRIYETNEPPTPLPSEVSIKITSPINGQTVSGSVNIAAEASSKNELNGMELSIQKEGETAITIPLTNCGDAVACPSGGGICIYTKNCKYYWDTSNYDGKVYLTVKITDKNNNKATDSIKVNVVNYQSCNEKCKSIGYRYGSCKAGCDADETDIGVNGCPQVACAPCVEGKPCPLCPVHKCCCINKKPCPYECCVNDPDYTDKPCPMTTCPVCEPGGECPPCIQPKCLDHRCSWHPQEGFILNFKAGWNMFSFPVDIRSYITATSQTPTEMTVEKAITGKATDIIQIPTEKQCESPDHVWHYSNGKYIDVLNDPNGFVNGWGYWVGMKSDCTVKMTGNKITIEDFPNLEVGWNQIGAPSEAVNFFHVIGDCNLVSGPWWFNSASKKFEKAQVLRPGEGYFVKVKDKCKLGTEIPPLPPEELSVVSKALKIK
jgi:hypothetical protein